MERSLLSSNHPEKQFDVKLPMAGKVFALVCLFVLSTQFAVAQNKIAVNALPTGGKVVAGAATISSTSTATSATMNINQTSQRAVINWQTFNVGKNATVNFNQPNSSAVTLNRVVSATPSMIQGAINANGQVILVNPNGVTFGKGAEVNAAGVVASTLNISNQDFMNGKNIYSGNGEGKIVNKGTITATDPNGYIALLAPEIRNQGYLIARMGPSSSVALASGEKISLDFRGTQLIGVSIDKAAYKALIENKRIIETNGGLIIVAAGTARELMSSVIQNTGRISANSIVDNGGVIELVADNVTNSGSISANGSTNGVGGQVNIVGNNITLAANSKTTATGNLGGGSIQVGVGKTVATNTTPASAVNGNANTAAAPQTAAQILASNTQGAGTQAQTVSVEQGAVVDASAINSGNGGAIVIWSQVKTTVNGILKAVGGYLNGNGGLIETSSAGLVSLGKSLSIDTSSGKGSAGLWYVDPIDLTIDGASSAVISAALVNNNVSITVAGNTCPSLGSCTQNGSGNLTIASGADIIKQSGSLTTLTLTASGVFNLNANISGQNLDVIINSSIAYLNAGSTITANQVTVQAQTIYSYGNINSGSLSNLGSAIQLLGSALYISGNLTVGANLANSSNSTNSNSNTVSYNGTLIRQEDLPTYLAAANQTTLNLDQVYATTAANQASFTTAVNNQITLTGTESISIAATAQLLANGTTGGVIMATAPQINLVTSSNSSPSSGSQSIQGNGSLIQANGNNGPGGTISFTAANDFNINFATISASGSTDGGSIRLISSGGNLLMANSLIQTNGGTGRGGSLGVSGANSTTIKSSTLEATGFSKGGSIMVGYDSAGKTLPYSESTTIDAATILNANQTDSTNTTGGGLIETSGGTLTQLASINAGRGGMWLLDPYDYVIGSLEASYIVQVLKTSQVYIVSTTNSQYSTNVPGLNQTNPGTGLISINADIIAAQQNGGGFNGINFVTDGSKPIYLGANINVYGTVQFSGPVVITHAGMVNVTAQNPIIFNSSIDADPGVAGSGGLTLNGTSVILGGCVSCTPGLGQLANLSISAPGGITLYGGLKTSGTPLQGTTASIMLSGPVSLMKSITLDSSNADLIIMDAVTTSTTPGQFGSPTSTTNLTINAGYSQGGQVYFGSTVNLAGSLTVNNAGTTYLAGNITTTGAQTYNGTVEVLGGNVQLQAAGISNITITGALQGGALANSSIYLYQNGYYSIDGGVMLTPLGVGGINSVTLGGGVLTYTGNNSGLNQSLYTWTPTYGIAGAVLAVGGGAGGNPGGSSGGGGGDGGSVVANRLIQFDANTTYSITVGMGGAAGLFTCCSAPTSGSFGGNTSLNGGGDYITATGGQGARPALTGGFGNGGANTAFGNIGGSGVQAFVQINNPLSNAGIYPNGNATWFGAGGNSGSTGAAYSVDGTGGAYVAGGGGGGGNTTYSGGGGSGGYGASGMLMIQQATQANSTALINAGGSFNLGSVNGSGANKSNLSGLNINANNSNSSISGAINGYIALSYSGLQSSSALTLSGSSTYIGSTTIYAGTIKAGSSTAFGNSNNIIYVASGSTPATLDFNGQNLGAYTINVRGAGVGNLGAIINSSATTANFAGSVNLTNVSFIGGDGTGNGAGAIYFNGSVNTNGYGLGFVNYSNDYMTGNNNQISTIAGSNMAILQLASTTNVTIGTVNGSSIFSGPIASGLSFASNSGSYLLINLPNNALTINNSITAAAISITASNASGGLDAIAMSGSYSITSPGGLGINITSTSGNINLASATITNSYSSCCSVPTSAINITSAGDVSLGNLVNQGQGGIRIAAGNQISTGITSGGTITQLGTVNNSGGVVGLSMAAPETSNCASSAACPIESRLGITASNADVSKNISYGVAGGSFTTPGAYTTGNYIDYRQSPSVTYNVSLGSNYTAIYGTSYISSSANTWLATNATVSIAGTAFGYSVSGALANLRFKNSIDGVTSANNVQSTSITSNSLMSSDLTPINVTGTTQTYTITPAPLGISVNGVYSGTNVITPTSFTTYGLVNGDTIGGLSTATLAFKDVNSVNNYVTAISIGTGSAILSNYQLNPLGRNIATNSALMNTVTLTPIALTVSSAVAANKTYDGTTVATLSSSGLNGVLAQDTANVALTLSSGSFANKNVGTNITVTAAGSISGSAVAAGDYTLIQPTVTANISPAPLGVSISGTYTGSTLINNPNIGIAGLVNNETLTSISQAVMSSPNVSANGSNYVVSFTIGAGTASLSNYVINSGYYATPGYTNNMVTLTPKTLTTSGSSAYSKTYDGTNIASINPGTLVGVINSDDVSILSNAGTFASSNAANNVVVTPNLVLGGTASSNYSLTQPTSLTANISKAPLGISIATTYNGSTTVTPTILGVNGLVNGETLSSITSAVISNANVANTLTTYATSITIGSGTASMSNYMLGSTRNNSTSSNSENIVTITPKALSLSAVKVYDGATTLSGSQITMTGLIGTQTLNYTGANINDANVATPNKYISSITLTDGANGGLASNYLAPTLTSAYTYNNATVNQKAVALSATKVYDANNTLTGGQVTINTGVGGETLTYSGATVNDINVATAGKYINAITLGNAVSGNGVASNYLLPTLNSTNALVTITKASLTVTANAAAMTYGASVLPSFSATITGFVGSDTSSAVTGTASFSTNATPYNGQAGSGSSVGTYSITPALGSLASGNYSFGVFSQGSLVVNKGNLTITASNDSKVYGASSTTAGVNYTAGGTAINSTAGYTTSGLVNGDTITAVTLTSTGGAVPTNVGTYTITPSALVGGTNVTNSNYTISYINASTGLAVNPKVVTLAATKTYDATNALNTVVISGLIGSQTLTYSGATTNDVNVATTGKYLNAITLGNATDGSGGLAVNYALPSLTVASANNAVTITAKVVGLSASKTYDATTTLTGAQVVITTGVGSQTLSYTGATANDANVATANKYISAITLANATDSSGGLASNYALPTLNNANAALTITPKALSLSAVKVYDGATTLSGSQITMTGLIGTQTLNYTGANINDANVATPNKYISSITLTDGANGGLASNYLAPTLTSAYTYNNATVNQKAVALSATKVYDANNTLTGGQVTINTGVGGETLTYSGATVNDINVATAGKYINAITLGNAVSGNGVASNYLLPTLNSTNALVTITKASLTVTANAAAMTYGASVLPSFSATITGFVGSDTSSAVTGTASFSTNATPYNGQAGSGSSVGTYSITPALGSLASGNYSFGVFSQGSLVVNKGNLTITASNDSKVYGASSTTAGVNYTAGGTAINSTAGYTTSGLVNGDTITAVTLTSTGGAVPTNVGTYTITPSALVGGTNVTNSNYTISYINASTGLAVNPKVVTLAATKTYDATNALNTVVISGLIGSQTLTYSGATTNDVNVATTGKYLNAITLGNATDGSGGLAVNYALPSLTVASANNAVTITAKVVGLSASKTYDATTTLTGAQVVITTGVGSQTLSYTGATANDANVATANKYISAITLANATDSSGGLASNYALPTLNNANAAVVISPKVVGLSAAKIYDATTALTGNQVTITTGINGQSLSYTGATANDSNVVTAGKVISAITLVNGTGGIASNYALPTLDAINAPVTITPKTVTLSAIKTYDSTTTLFAGQVTINTGITGEALTYSAGTINNANVSANGSNFITALTLNSLTGTASNYALPTLNSTNAPVTVNPAPLTVTGSVSPDKTYDGTTVTTVSNGQLQGLINNQTLTLSQAGAFASANAGTAINVVVNDSIANGTGTNAGIASNYSLTQPTDVVANITPKNLTVTGSATSNKVYDGTFTATITGGQLVGVVAADIANVVLTQTGTFTAANVGNAIAITANDSLSGTQAGNYSLTQPTVAAANITPKTLSLSATKTYDSTTSLLGAVTILTGVGTETLGYTAATASDANVVTTGKYITAITLVNGSGLASNYVLPVLNVANAPVTINPVTALVVVGATAQGKAYDGTTSVTLSNTGTLQGLIGNQTLTLTEAGAFTSANAGSGVFVVMNDRIADGTNGGLASNYSLTQPTYVMAPIAKAPLGVTVSGTYTASTTIAPSTFTTNGLVNNETITALSSATVNDANVMTANNYVKSIVIGAGTANVNNYVIGPNYNNLAGNTQNIATITPKVITVSGTQVANKEYNATTTANLTGGTLAGVINSDSANVNLVQAGNFASANIGNPVAVTASDTITGSAASNYSLTQPTGLSAIITSKALTITIAAETKIYGDGIAKTSNSVDGTNTSSQSVNYTNGVATNSFQGFSVSGLVTGSNDAVNTVTLTSAGGALTAGVASGATAYAITGSGAVGVNLGNYAINYVSNNYSVMTVTPRPLNVTVANASMAYGATALPNFTSTITGLVNGDQASAVLSTTATPYNGQAGSASNIGSYAITAAAVSNANYSVISTNGTLTVNPVTLVLQANTQGGTGSPIVYGTPTVLNQNASVALTAASLAGLTNGDYINTVSVTFNTSQTISGATAAGTYTGALVASGASGTGLSNYTMSYQPGNLIISKAVLTVTAANDARFTSQTEATGTYNGVVFSGFKNADTVSNLDMSGLVINRVNTTTPNTPVSNNVGNYAGSLAPSGIATSSCNTCLPNGNAQNGSPSLNGNYTFNYVNGNYSILGAGQILVKYAPVTMSYGSVTNANINYGTPVVSYMDPTSSNVITLTSGQYQISTPPTITSPQNSTAGYLSVGSYSLNPTGNISTPYGTTATIVGGITVMPKVLSFANLGISAVSKVYDGLTTMTGLSLNVGTGVFLAQGPTTDNVTVVANGAFTDKNVGTAKSYTVGVSFGGADANNYVISGGGVYTADGITNPANGTITQLSSVTYIGAATGGAWSDPNSWQVTNGTTKGAIPDASMVNGVATNNVANIIVPVGNTVVYDAGVSNAAPITSNLANAGNVSFGSALASNATFNVAMTISGAGSVTIAGPGTLTLSGANTYTGNTIISNGSTLSVTAANSIGAGNIQGSGGSLRVANGISLAQINATGTLRLLSDVVTSGNQAWGNLTVTQSPLTTLTSTNGNITFNGLLDGASSKANSLLVLAPNGNVTFNNSVGSVMPLNVLEVDASRININADVLTSDQQNYCGMAGCYSQLSSAQVSANYCATTGNNCYSKNTSTLAFNLLASGTGTTGDYVLNTDIQVNPAPTAQVYIGDNGAVGFLYNTYGTYATKAFGSTPPLFQNNAVFARTLISKDPMVTFGGAINDASAASTHTLQAAAIKVSNASSPNIQFGGSIGNTNPLYSINALTQFIDAANSMNGSIKFAANTTITSISNMSYGSNSFTPTGVTFQTVSPSASINFVVPAGSPFSLAGGQIKSNYVNYNGAATRTLGGITAQVSLSGGIVTPRAAAPVSAPSTRNSFILAAVAEQTKIERKYDVDASVDVGEIETDDGPAAADDQDDKKKKKAGNQKAAQ
ncbi:filamentous hemagglutinin N-terminal domain-containing protein [Polynucleobacter paneuropaeus]|nr:filamentous hemagglutinin N-terminal domain-containing protein [Polynucleobacter paneuropaeus]